MLKRKYRSIELCVHDSTSVCKESPISLDFARANQKVSAQNVLHVKHSEVIEFSLFLIRDNIRTKSRYETPYKRPNTGIAGKVSALLAPLPSDEIVYSSPTKANVNGIKSYRLHAFVLAILAIVLIVGLAYSVPVLRTSPLLLISKVTDWLFGDGILSNIATGIGSFVLFYVINSFFGNVALPNHGRFIDKAALTEELWFRTGAESWSKAQRIKSCVLFSAVHIPNIIYPLSSLIVVGLLGGAFMAQYLTVFKATGSYVEATMHSAKLHATFNRFAILYSVLAIATLIFFSW